MNDDYDCLDTSKLCYDGDFDTQISNLMMHVRLTRTEVENLTQLFDDLEGALGAVWPGSKVFPFGSIVTGMGIRTSDVDCYVHLPKYVQQRKSLVMIARSILQKHPQIFQNLFAIVTAKVPIVKLFHVPTSRHCDVNFKSAAGVRNSQLLAYLLYLDIRALNLAIIVKYWSKVHGLTGTNRMPSYALALLVIFYLQQEKLLPPVSPLQRNIEPEFIDHWNTAFNDQTPYVTYNKKSLYQLLGGFFKFYNNFKFRDSVISVYDGRAYNRQNFESINNVPTSYDLYKANVTSDFCKMLRIDSCLCIQDPFEHNRNCAVAVYPRLADRVINCFKSASNAYEEESSENFLQAILKHTETEEIITQPKRHIPHKRNAPYITSKNNANRGFKQNKFNKKAIKNTFVKAFEDINRQRKGKS